jgi:hypothetical protein
VLDSIRSGPSLSLSVLLDFQQSWNDPLVIRRLRNLLPAFTKEGRFLAVVGSRLELPDGLADDIAVSRLPFPDRTELSALLAVYDTQSRDLHSSQGGVDIGIARHSQSLFG